MIEKFENRSFSFSELSFSKDTVCPKALIDINAVNRNIPIRLKNTFPQPLSLCVISGTETHQMYSYIINDKVAQA